MGRGWCKIQWDTLEDACGRVGGLWRAARPPQPLPRLDRADCLAAGTQEADPCKHSRHIRRAEEGALHRPKPQLVLSPSLNLSWW